MNRVEKLIRVYKRRARKLIERVKYRDRKRVVVLGDSHVAVFNYINQHIPTPYYFEVGYVSGATALGTANPNSKTNSLLIFRNKLRRTNSSVPIIIQLGEVDCGFVIYYLAEKQGKSVIELFDRSVANYQQFVLEEVVERGFRDVYILSATLPTLKDYSENKGEIAQLRHEVKASQLERTQLTKHYNARMKQFCLENNISFIDLDNELSDPDTGLIKAKYLHRDPLDHHNDPEVYSQAIMKAIHEIAL